jgi:hypothetical protein
MKFENLEPEERRTREEIHLVRDGGGSVEGDRGRGKTAVK